MSTFYIAFPDVHDPQYVLDSDPERFRRRDDLESAKRDKAFRQEAFKLTYRIYKIDIDPLAEEPTDDHDA